MQDAVNPLLVALEHKDKMTRVHCDRVHNTAVRLGIELGVTGQDLDFLEAASLCHDIGKVGIPDGILFKPGPLTQAERSVIMTHSEMGERIVAACNHPWAEPVSKIVRSHHERADGSGYPDKLTLHEISIHARIIGLADFYDALLGHRPYRAPLRPCDIIEMAQLSRAHWDPEVLSALVKIYPTL
jgi:HD-GYP domain-containing protein (c-di-GMP phosphodiesterase class II)